MFLTTITNSTPDSNSGQLDNGKVQSQSFRARTFRLNVEACDENIELNNLTG